MQSLVVNARLKSNNLSQTVGVQQNFKFDSFEH